MFDIGFWEMVMIAVVALVVVGPRELPGMIRTVSGWIRHARQVAGELRDELSREVSQVEELKRLVEKEAEIAEVHRALEEARATIAAGGEEAADRREEADSPAGGASADASRRPAPSSPESRGDDERSG